jgi:hypothetical protein
MSWRNSHGRSLNAPAAFIHPCQPTVAKEPPSGPGWARELEHDGYRLQIHVRDGRVRLFTMNGADWSKRYPRIVEEAARIKSSAVMDAEVVCLIKKGIPDFDMLHSRTADHLAVACAFDLLMHDSDDLRRQPLRERKFMLSKLLMRSRDGIQYMRALGGRAPYCPYNPDQQTCADESGNQVTQPSAKVDAEEAKNDTRNRRPDDSEHDVYHKSHIALHKLFCQPTRSALRHPQASEKNYETFFCSLEDESGLGGCSLRSW